MNKIGVISLVISISTFFLKLVDAFPEYKEILKVISLIFLGIVIGIVISKFTKDEVKLKNSSLRDFYPYFYYGGLGLLFLIVLGLMIQQKDEDKIFTLNTWLTSIGGFAFFSLVFSFHDIFPKRNENVRDDENSTDNEIPIDEKIMLAESHRNEKNYSRSLHFFESVKNDLKRGDIRIREIEKKISEVKALQINRK